MAIAFLVHFAQKVDADVSALMWPLKDSAGKRYLPKSLDARTMSSVKLCGLMPSANRRPVNALHRCSTR
ncbi:hypothetical protein TELCIR_02940 [Teladorsagia circumcincta]|uniref:Uncharacterized protein n=1 Tax=Teladorsagia circumcincta TaxID=45464 RepID=A0A2G9UXT5_TELCI|nr:hypothetical protein TELCIR_02940 [Teladorsagia circumcincta]